jgi:hypothetical protein
LRERLLELAEGHAIHDVKELKEQLVEHMQNSDKCSYSLREAVITENNSKSWLLITLYVN